VITQLSEVNKLSKDRLYAALKYARHCAIIGHQSVAVVPDARRGGWVATWHSADIGADYFAIVHLPFIEEA
jgi:hypothetical protein